MLHVSTEKVVMGGGGCKDLVTPHAMGVRVDWGCDTGFAPPKPPPPPPTHTHTRVC